MCINVADVILSDVYIGVVKEVNDKNVIAACHDGTDKTFPINSVTIVVEGDQLVDMFVGGVLRAEN